MRKRKLNRLIKPNLLFSAILGGNIEFNDKKKDKNRTKCPKKRLQFGILPTLLI
jgi:hypothetical protein